MKISTAAVIVATLMIAPLVIRAADGPPPPPPPPRESLDDLNLTPEQKQKVDAITRAMQQKERALHDEYLKQLATVLSTAQMQQMESGHQGAYVPIPKGTVVFHGGYDLDPRDHGRPVVLIAAALNVPEQTFRDAFSHVKPAGPNEEPQDEQVRKNKSALMDALSPLGVTDDRLNEVSNYYRYSGARGQFWKVVPASATATITDGMVTGITLTNPGAGYTTPPTVTVAGYENIIVKVELSFGPDLKTNGSIKSLALVRPTK